MHFFSLVIYNGDRDDDDRCRTSNVDWIPCSCNMLGTCLCNCCCTTWKLATLTGTQLCISDIYASPNRLRIRLELAEIFFKINTNSRHFHLRGTRQNITKHKKLDCAVTTRIKHSERNNWAGMVGMVVCLWSTGMKYYMWRVDENWYLVSGNYFLELVWIN